jgi:hypothetical protein
MDHTQLLEEITKRLDEKIDLIREDLKAVTSTEKDHEVRLVKLESTAGYITNALLGGMGLVGSVLAYIIYKVIDIWAQKS